MTAYRKSIHDFAGASTQLALPAASQDWGPVIEDALASGEAIGFPAGQYRIASFSTDGSNATPSATAGIFFKGDVRIDVECALGARFYAEPSVFSGVSGSLFQLQASTAPDQYGSVQSGSLVKTPLTTFKWSGGEFDGSAITSVDGNGQGLTLLDISQYYMPEVSGVRFNGGFRIPAATDIGSGKIDTGLGVHGCVSGRYHDNDFVGCADSGVYLNGTRQTATGISPVFSSSPNEATLTVSWTPDYADVSTATLVTGDYIGLLPSATAVPGSNPVTLPAGGADVQIALSNADTVLKIGDKIFITGATTIGTSPTTLNINGERTVTLVNSARFDIDIAAPFTSPSGGGSGIKISPRVLSGVSVYGRVTAVDVTPMGGSPRQYKIKLGSPAVSRTVPWTFTVTNGRSDNLDFGLSGDDQVSGCRFYRCGNMVAAKRNDRVVTVSRCYGFECGNGVVGRPVTEPLSEGKRFCIDRNVFYKIQGYPISLTGSRDDIITHNRMMNFGRLISSNGATPTSAASAIGAIDLRSCDNPLVLGNLVKQEDTWKQSGDEATAVLMTADGLYKSGVQYAKVANNYVSDLYKAIGEFTPSNHSDFDGNETLGIISVNRLDGASHRGLPPTAFAPVLLAGGATVAVGAASGTYTIRDGWLEFAIYLGNPTTAAIAGINTSGALTISGLPRVNAFDDAAFSLVTRGLASNAQNTDLLAYMNPGAQVVTLARRASGATSGLTGAALTTSSKITVVGSYFIGQA